MTKDEALKLALETLEYAGPSWIDARQPAITAIKAALEAKDEPSMKVEGPLHVICQCDKCKPQIAFNAEVVGYVAPQQELVCVCGAVWEGQELVETPPQRTWVGLTDEDRLELAKAQYAWEDLCLAVDAKLKQKNS